MKQRLLLIVPFVVAAGVAATLYVIGPVDHERIRPWNALVKAVAATCAFVAFAGFRRGDYMRGAWAALGVCMGALAARDLLIILHLLGQDFVSRNVPQL